MRTWARQQLGLILDPWQTRALHRALVHDRDGILLQREYLTSTGRQNGKTAAVRALIGWALTAWDTPAWSRIHGLARDRPQARIPYLAVRDDLGPIREAHGGLRLTRYLGIESTLPTRRPLPDPTRQYDVASREARDTVRGLSVDLWVLDEVRTQRDWDTVAAAAPTQLARPDPLRFAISSAGDDRSVVLRAWFDRGLRIIAGEDPAGFGMTWYAAPDDAEPDDRAAWALANPAIASGRLRADALVSDLASMPAAVFRREHLNLWTDASGEWLPAGAWQRTVGAPPEVRSRAILGVEVTPTWHHATVVVAVPTDAGAWCGVVAELSPTFGAIAPAQLVELVAGQVAAWSPEAIAYSSAAAAAPHMAAWAEVADVRAVPLHGGQLRAASELLRSETVGGRLTHPDDPLLSQQVAAARPSGALMAGSWYLSLRLSSGDIDAIRALAWAAWALLLPQEDLKPAVW